MPNTSSQHKLKWILFITTLFTWAVHTLHVGERDNSKNVNSGLTYSHDQVNLSWSASYDVTQCSSLTFQYGNTTTGLNQTMLCSRACNRPLKYCKDNCPDYFHNCFGSMKRTAVTEVNRSKTTEPGTTARPVPGPGTFILQIITDAITTDVEKVTPTSSDQGNDSRISRVYDEDDSSEFEPILQRQHTRQQVIAVCVPIGVISVSAGVGLLVMCCRRKHSDHNAYNSNCVNFHRGRRGAGYTKKGNPIAEETGEMDDNEGLNTLLN